MKLWHATLLLGAVAIQHSDAWAFPGEAIGLPFQIYDRSERSLTSTFPFNQRQPDQDHDRAKEHQIHDRSRRSLLNTFPFNQRQPDHDHDHAHEHHDHHEELPTGDNKQIRQGATVDSTNALDISAIADSKEKCIEKVMMIEETQYDDGIECHHSYDKKCHTTYTTDYEPQQVEECSENYVKECYIEYKPSAHNETVEICNEKPIKDCSQPGPTVCEKVYESVCETNYHLHESEDDVPQCRVILTEMCKDVVQGYTTKQECSKWPKQVCELKKENTKKYTPDTKCVQQPREVCGPGPCPVVTGPKECRTETKTVVQEVPEETCSLKVQPVCKHVTKLVPALLPAENCVDIPKEVCVRVRTNPRKVKKPVIKKWCYVPTEESGLASNPPAIKASDDIDRLGRSNSKLTHLDDLDEAVTASTILPELEAASLTEETTISN